MGILVKHNKPTVSKYTLEGDSTLYLGIDRHPFTMGKVIFFYEPDGNKNKSPLTIRQFKYNEIQRPVKRAWAQVEGYRIVILADGFNGTPTLPPPELWEIQRDINTMCEWYAEQIKSNKSMNKKFKIK